MSDFCRARDVHTGLLCLKKTHSQGPHRSWDNTKLDSKGNPGAPVSWHDNRSRETQLLDPTSTAGEASMVSQLVVPPRGMPKVMPGYTGIPCDACGSLNTVRRGSCLYCEDCKHTGECG